MSTSTSSIQPHKPRLLTPPPPQNFSEDIDPSTERGRKRRRSSATNQSTQLPSATLRGRGRRRSSSLHPIPVEITSSQDAASLPGQAQGGEGERHRSRSPDRRFSIENSAISKEVRDIRAQGVKMLQRGENGKDGVTAERQREHKKRRSQSPSRSRSVGHEGDVKLRRRQRTRSRSRSHGNVNRDAVSKQENDDDDDDDDDDDEVAVED